MKRLLAVLIFASTTTHCMGQMMQVMSVSPMSDGIEFSDGFHRYENDTISISYDFWSERGLFKFSVRNKLNIPIYIDWKKSFLNWNSDPLPYWSNEVVLLSETKIKGGFYATNFLGSSVGSVSGKSKTETRVSRQERITVIPPNGEILCDNYHIVPEDNLIYMGATSQQLSVPKARKPNKKVAIYQETYDSLSSPIKLSNFLAVSFEENFDDEFFISNNFYLSEVMELDERQFLGAIKGKELAFRGGLPVKVNIYEKPLKKSSNFYMDVPKVMEFQSRRKMPDNTGLISIKMANPFKHPPVRNKR
ncbi:hypothetical protein OAE93_00220 [bacterium]|nr:hypothetical protein [bacterium]